MNIDTESVSDLHRAAAEELLRLATAMLRELRPATPLRELHLDDTIERDLGLDSLSRVELVARVEQAFGVRLPDELATAARTLRDLLDAVTRGHPALETIPSAAPVQAAPPSAVAGAPDRASTLVEAFRWHLERHPDREHITLLDGDRTVDTISYGRLWQESGDVARGFKARGIGRGDAVAIMLPTSGAFFQGFLGALRIGAVPVPMYPPLRWSEIGEHVRGRAAILANSFARLLITVPEAMFVGKIAAAELPGLQAAVSIENLRSEGGAIESPAIAGIDTAMLQYTSGSTGDPKGVILSHDNLLADIRAMGRAASVTSSDRFVSWLPLYHDMGLIGAWLGSMYYAVPLVLMPPQSFLARPSRWLWAIHRHRATISAGPNFAYEIAASKIRDEDLVGLELSSWRLAFNGAEPVRAATLDRFASRFARFGFDRRALTPVYGLAECALGLAFPPLERGPLVDRIDARKLANEGRAAASGLNADSTLEVVSCGRPLPGHEIRVVDEVGREVAERTEGRIEFRGPSATAGYHRNPVATARLFRGAWLDTGDIGYIAGGELFVTSRAKDLIKRGGHNIHPYDLEAAIGEVPGIRKGCVAVFGTSDRGTGTERVVVVAETHRVDADSRTALRDRIMALAAIHLNGPADEVLLVPARTVLKTSSGKIRRAACRELYEKGLLEAPRHAVWVQIAGLLGEAAVARMRRVVRTVAEVGYGIYAWALFLSFVVVLLPLAFVLRPTPLFAVARRAARMLLRCLGIEVSIEGSEHLTTRGPAVIVVNHSSYIDAIVLTAVLPFDVRFAAKREFTAVPLMGFALRRLGAYFVERIDAGRGVEDTRRLVDAARRGETIVLFPEGTFSRAPGIAPFHLGPFAVSAQTGAPVIAVVLRGTRSVLREHRWLPARHPVSVIVQPPIEPRGGDWSAAVKLRDQVREKMLDQSDEPDLAAPTER